MLQPFRRLSHGCILSLFLGIRDGFEEGWIRLAAQSVDDGPGDHGRLLILDAFAVQVQAALFPVAQAASVEDTGSVGGESLGDGPGVGTDGRKKSIRLLKARIAKASVKPLPFSSSRPTPNALQMMSSS